ncbi:MAG: hydrogenase expression/formation protein HypE [Bauldia sp.]|uniref:hydrogenase expression/formation protein HypE n=1 Tax=Bauldia sp. TaxID=2575872 RepID=UPI001D2557AD|nr:hydrogenase expression/formation protein HypE [Bauldia sp.]MCB1496275.1 hydrogenase expression/formation protein HypE [Bauldia sp.]
MSKPDFSPACPAPAGDGGTVQLAHGGGGRAMERLLDTVIRPAFDNAQLARRHDGAVLDLNGPIAFTTDSYVVKPLFFPGGDIGSLAVNGTVNDIAMCGARATHLSVGLILEEGLPLDDLRRVVASMRKAADAVGVQLVTGDTKVVDHGKADGLFINTAGLGPVVARSPIGPAEVRNGDAIIVSGDIGRHGIAVMAAREGFGFETVIESDCAALGDPALALVEAGIAVHCLRDMTRGGLASAAVEIAETAGVAMALDEAAIPVREDVRAACEVLGLDPLHVANEGRFVAFVAAGDAKRAIEILRGFAVSAGAAQIGAVTESPAGQVASRGVLGVSRVVDMLSGEQLPRIC